MVHGEPQPVLAPITEASIFLTLTFDAGGDAAAVRDVLSDVAGLKRSVGFRLPEGELTCVLGIGSQAWDRLFGGPRPASLHPFRALHGAHEAPSTPGDLLFHLRAHRLDMCFELAQLLVTRLRPHATVVDEVHGFRFFDERDLLGFVDGTESPQGAKAVHAAIVGDEDSHFTGGSYAVAQKYLHDMAAWNALTVEAQEQAIGRSKVENIEQPDEQKASNAHLVLNTLVDDDGTQLQIVRDNMPFGRVGDGKLGTYFISYAARVSTTEKMLENMFIGRPTGNHDRLLDFSRAVTGGLFFAPSATFFDDLPPAPVGTPARSSANGPT
jgi:porphyrinogen peroxidase